MISSAPGALLSKLLIVMALHLSPLTIPSVHPVVAPTPITAPVLLDGVNFPSNTATDVLKIAPQSLVVKQSVGKPVAIPLVKLRPLNGATPQEAAYLSCVRFHESRDQFWAYGYYPNGQGDGGGSFQMEPKTHLFAAHLAGISPNNHSAGAQYREALMLYRAEGRQPWEGDGC